MSSGCIELKSIAQIEESYTDAQGKPAVRRVPAARVVPGTEVIWTMIATNVCRQRAENVSIDNPVPEHMSYVADSAAGTGAEVTYSLDGVHYAAAAALQVRDADGALRPARADEYKAIRWTFRNPIGPGQLATASFRATVR
ncbi:MAG: hypothetical protein RML32_08520 [Gammaproteobacteria bacterium]|nr:hypothetical protein [Gammaproteobacteria bacterium]